MSLWNWCPEDPACLGLHGWTGWSYSHGENRRECVYCGYVEHRR